MLKLTSRKNIKYLTYSLCLASGVGTNLLIKSPYFIRTNNAPQYIETTASLYRLDNKIITEQLSKKEKIGVKNIEVPIKWTSNTVHVKRGDSLYKILSKSDISNSFIHEIVKKIKLYNKDILNINIGDKIVLNFKNNKIFSFDIFMDKTKFHKIIINEKDSNILIYDDELQTYKENKLVKGQIKTSLYVDGLSSGLNNKLVVELADVFAWDIDFGRDITSGNKFSVIYEQIKSGDDVIDTGNIVAASFETNNGKHYAFRYEKEDGEFGYYDENGRSLEKAFIRSPVKFPRITSRFTYKRYHPVLKRNRPHRGVDYGGKQGTPIMTTGSGVISHIGKRGAYGNAIIINHGQGYQTLYAHMVKFKKGLKKGSEVKQGQVIGYMGKTGLVTGVHLHYEFRIDGVHQDPLTVKLPDGKNIRSDKNYILFKDYMLKLLNS